ncbi:MXAN_6640 family putative metalloprotease [Melioribacteraceae bacterium 4301-Me]|uniref:MXAN_6640 family putative metalloprotease n=1 Tax=Pyranulibacter aquaticus TaxID=3163344 RepID=UPI0035990C53
MKSLLKLIIIFFPLAHLYSQNLDSLYLRLLSVKGVHVFSIQSQTNITLDTEKCATGIINQVIQNLQNYDLKRRKEITSLLQRPATDTSFVTPNGKFRIHFNKSDYPDYIPDEVRKNITPEQIIFYKKIYLDSLAIAVDSAYNYEVNILGYPAPPPDNGAGGDNLYDIYIQNLSNGFYGYTEIDQLIGDSTYTSFIVIDNDYSNYNTKRINAARVTVAHEMHHAIQMGNYIYRSSDQYYYEITSSSMEEFVFNDVNDYYFYMSSYFSNPGRSFSANSGYNLAIWNIFLADRFGVNIIKRTWELMKAHNRALISISAAIQENNSNFKIEFNLFGQWIYFTNFRSVPGKYFKEAANYPLVKPIMNLAYDKNKNSLMLNTSPVSLNFVYFNNFNDTMVAVISNSDVYSGINSNSNLLSLTYYYSSVPFSGSKTVIDGFYSLLETSKPDYLSESNIFNYVPVNDGIIKRSEIDFCYPQPFKYSANSSLYIPVSKDNNGYADLYIYSISMKLVYSSQKKIQAFDKFVVSWNGLDNNGNRLPTGVYFYVTKSGENTKKGKFVIYND